MTSFDHSNHIDKFLVVIGDQVFDLREPITIKIYRKDLLDDEDLFRLVNQFKPDASPSVELNLQELIKFALKNNAICTNKLAGSIEYIKNIGLIKSV